MFRGGLFVIFDDFLKTKKMRNVRTIILAVVSRRDLCYVSENEGFRFWKKAVIWSVICPRNLPRNLPSEFATKKWSRKCPSNPTSTCAGGQDDVSSQVNSLKKPGPTEGIVKCFSWKVSDSQEHEFHC